jgi:cytochrome P450
VKEVLRLYPAIPVFPRQAAQADVLPSGHAIRQGDVVFMSTYALHRSPAVWRDPLNFDPERWAAAVAGHTVICCCRAGGRGGGGGGLTGCWAAAALLVCC